MYWIDVLYLVYLIDYIYVLYCLHCVIYEMFLWTLLVLLHCVTDLMATYKPGVSFYQNLDVNLAVNNLLSRDDEGDDDDDSQDGYMPGGDLTLL